MESPHQHTPQAGKTVNHTVPCSCMIDLALNYIAMFVHMYFEGLLVIFGGLVFLFASHSHTQTLKASWATAEVSIQTHHNNSP